MVVKVQDVLSGSIHSGESPEAAHVDCVETGWCVRMLGQSGAGQGWNRSSMETVFGSVLSDRRTEHLS